MCEKFQRQFRVNGDPNGDRTHIVYSAVCDAVRTQRAVINGMQCECSVLSFLLCVCTFESLRVCVCCTVLCCVKRNGMKTPHELTSTILRKIFMLLSEKSVEATF